MGLIDMQFPNLFHFSTSDLYSLLGKRFSPPDAFTAASKKFHSVLVEGKRNLRTVAGIMEQ